MKGTAFILLVVLFSSCSLFRGLKEGKEYETSSGLKYEIKKKGTGDFAGKGDLLKVHYTGKFSSGKIFDSSLERGQPFVFRLGEGKVIPGWEEAFSRFPVGTKATVTVPPELAYGDKKIGNIPANSTLVFDLEFLDIIVPPPPFEVAGRDTIHLESGLKFIKLNSTMGFSAEAFRTVSIHYTGYLKNGTRFDSSYERGMPMQFKLGMGNVIKGLDKGITFLRTGEKARFIIPSDLGYGEKGFPPSIPSGATLVFDVELLEVY